MTREENSYRLVKISIRRGWAIDQIKFVYDDGKIWSVGIDGGTKDNRDFIMTPGEYLVRVTHETLNQRWYAGASVEFETNKGRVVSFLPYFSTGIRDQLVTMKADPGNEIIMLKIKHGKLIDVVQQRAQKASSKIPKFGVINRNYGNWLQNEFYDREDAVTQCKKDGGIVVDYIRNKVIHSNGQDDLVEDCREKAFRDGYLVKPSQESGGFQDLLHLIRSHMDFRADFPMFLTILGLLSFSHYVGAYSEVLSGFTLSSFLSSKQDSIVQQSGLPNFICDHFYNCDDGRSSKIVLILCLLFTKLLQNVLYAMNIFVHSVFKESRLTEKKKRLFQHTLSQEMGFFDTRTVGDIKSSMNPTSIIDIIAWRTPYLIADVFRLFFMFFYMIQMNKELTLLSLCFMVTFRLIIWPIEKKYELIVKMEEKIYTLMEQTQNESLSMISSVKHFSKEGQHMREQSDALDQMQALSYKKNTFRMLETFISGAFEISSFCLSLAFLSIYWDEVELETGQVTAFYMLFRNVYSIFSHINSSYLFMLTQLPVAEKVSNLIEKKPLLKSGPLEPASLKGKIEFRDVSFTYPSRPGQQILKNLNLVLQPGKVTAIVGDSGAGKSTVTNLIMRLYDPTSGNIYMDDFNLRELDLETYHRHIAVVNQNPLLFNSSIGENIAYGAPKNSVSEKAIVEAAKLANAFDFIMSFRGGFDTLAGTLGTQLSGGQKQRLSIARAVVRNPRIMILDEATSSLDAENEQLVNDALERVMVGRTILVIAHRLSTIRNADEILVMKNGLIVESGNHEELVNLNGVYKKLIMKQLE